MSFNSSERTISAAGGSSPTGTNPLTGAHHFISMKLTSRNFLFWRTQLLPFLRGQDLIGFVDGSTPYPPPTVAATPSGESSSGATTADTIRNLAHKLWVQQDQSILSLLIYSMSDEVLHLAVGQNTAAEVWHSICMVVGSNTQARCLNLLGQFQSLRQRNATPVDYLGRAKLLVEALAQAGQPLSLVEQTLYVLRGLRPEYRMYAASLTANSPVTHPQMADYLQAADFILADDYPTAADGGHDGSHTALYAGRGHGGSSSSHVEGGRRGGRCSRNSNQGRGGLGGIGAPMCQICRSHGHTAVYCFKRYSTQPPAQANVAVSGDHKVAPVPSPNAWYPDTGATAPATPDASMLNSSDDYGGSDTLRVGNGTGLAISRIGLASIPSVSKQLFMSNVLHVPKLTVPLLSVQKFANDNQVYFEFHDSCFLVKDSKTKATLLKGPISGGLYQLPVSRCHFAFVSSRAKPAGRHRRLGHPHSLVQNKVLQNYPVQPNNAKDLGSCTACHLDKSS
ncbi:PREDICTED: uncharacterized protein LOC109152118 [Ipomoea nil]|uniref:uncharacterized protein LOC109152118 n=1 Tax=Ipomoea nil TaxID=35883 RepID=UPI0009009DE1|nr:PREDICTED: uncharacterized protein LOC109152118 [Ipomoea nil]